MHASAEINEFTRNLYASYIKGRTTLSSRRWRHSSYEILIRTGHRWRLTGAQTRPNMLPTYVVNRKNLSCNYTVTNYAYFNVSFFVYRIRRAICKGIHEIASASTSQGPRDYD